MERIVRSKQTLPLDDGLTKGRKNLEEGDLGGSKQTFPPDGGLHQSNHGEAKDKGWAGEKWPGKSWGKLRVVLEEACWWYSTVGGLGLSSERSLVACSWFIQEPRQNTHKAKTTGFTEGVKLVCPCFARP